METLAHTWLHSNIDFVSFSSGLSYKLHLAFCLECFQVIDYRMNRVHLWAKAWFNPSVCRHFRTRKLKLQHPLETQTVDFFPEYLFSGLCHWISPHTWVPLLTEVLRSIVSEILWLSERITTSLQPLEGVRSTWCRLLRDHDSYGER